MSALLRAAASQYVTADLSSIADLQLNIEKMDLPDESFQVVVCSHVLEHVNDRAAISEIYRILEKGGLALLMVPLVEGWNETYENATITAAADRERHFGQHDHVRYYGRDFADRLRDVGFKVDSFVADGALCIKHGLFRGEKLFVATH